MSDTFASFLAQYMDEFLKFKRSLGHPYERGEYTLRNFDRYTVRATAEKVQLPLRELVTGWLSEGAKGRKPVTVTNELAVIR